MVLSERLKVIYLKVVGGVVADIGTDHAYLPIALIKGNRCKKVIACDIREKPLLNAKHNVEASGVKNIELRLSDGLSAVAPGEATTVVIAGMGGEVIAGILERCEYIKDPAVNLILQPMTSAGVLREWLVANGFGNWQEQTVTDSGKIYTVITVNYGGKKPEIHPAFYEIGTIKGETDTDIIYIEKELKILKKLINDLNDCGKKSELLPQLNEKYEILKKVVGK